MGQWAENAAIRFRNEASKKRQDDELELQRHSKTVAGAEKRWAELVKFIKAETVDFNRLMERQFLTLSEDQDGIEVRGPELTLKAWLDRRTPEINFEYEEAGPNTTESGEYGFLLQGKGVLITDRHGATLPVETLGARLLDPLIL